ncbi:EpsG family protein [uncultured Algoriphagus sp.]|uniref:EpsG family protein n=1 Tax=uncultured Algoriphagus sp. TaxID=417365 RepID=UPI0030EEEDC6|tara:strand:- start:21495 stop:22481 length:987 start_codon:yes stop_codon:yes gene_type:complete
MKSTYITYDQILWGFILLLLIPIVGFRMMGLDADYFNYLKFFKAQNDLELLTKEFGFRFLLGFNSFVFRSSINTFFLIFASLGISIKVWSFSKHSPIPILSFILYLLSYFLLHDYTQIRAGVASGFFLLALPDLSKGDKSTYFFKVVMACMFHWTALIMIPLYFFIRKFSLRFFALLPLVGILIFLPRINFEQYILSALSGFPALALYYATHSGHDSAINIFNAINMAFLGLFFVICFVIYYMKDEFSTLEISLFKVFSTSIFSFYFFAILNKPVMAFRVFEFLNISLLLLIPYLVDKFKQWYLASVGFLLFFFFYFMHLILNVRVIP